LNWSPPNKPPIVNSGPDQTVNAGDRVKLDGSKSRDPDGRIVSYLWKQIAGLPVVTLNGTDTAIATFTAPKDISSNTDLIFELTVTDSKNAKSVSTVKVTDKYIPPPSQHPPKTGEGGKTNTVTATIKIGTNPSGVSVNPTTNTVYVANNGDNIVSVIGGKTNTIIPNQ
jgi:hypothetical protein